MGTVFANGREISAKKDANRSIAAMPDVCLSPPSPPAGPIPIPYPNTSQASDTDGGSKTVLIMGGEIGLKNVSTYKTSKGDEAATRSLGMGVVTHTIQGKTKHAAWSMDVKVEGKNVIRHMDMTTHNHINNPNIALTLDNAGVAEPMETEANCQELDAKREKVASKELDSFVKGNTLSVANYTSTNGQNALMKAVSHNDMVRAEFSAGYCKPKPWPQTNVAYKDKNGKDKTRKQNAKGPVGKACKETSPYNPQATGHAEARMIETIMDAARKNSIGMPTGPGGLGSLTLNIHWKPTNGDDSNMPCEESCKGLICEAIACGLNIIICDGGQPTQPEC